MYVCMYVCVYVCVYGCMAVYVCVYMYMYINYTHTSCTCSVHKSMNTRSNLIQTYTVYYDVLLLYNICTNIFETRGRYNNMDHDMECLTFDFEGR